MSLMLPGSYSQAHKNKAKKRDDKILDSDIQSEPENIKSHEERTNPDIVEGRTSNQNMEHSKAQPPKDWTPIYTEPPRPGYDDYGKELGKEARVWKTYVQEASRWDADLVDGWNRSLDLILIFAALFSAISTTFVIESSKKLQEDPAETSAKTLSAISQTLFSIANNQPGSPLNLTAPESDRFVIPASAVCINALWFLSLSLSIAVSLVAMLAKDWARGYVAELTGQPYQQARKRQRRWDGLKEWRVPEVIMFLPSLLHLALLLFAVGLTIYLWTIHLGAAIPVLAVTLASIVVYGALTALPLLHEHCPYSTPLSKLIQILPKLVHLRRFSSFRLSNSPEDPSPPSESLDQDQGQGQNEDLMDELTSRALAWLIVNYEDTKSADIALQAIAGANHKLPLEPLSECGAHSLIQQRLDNCFNTRLTTQKLYLKDTALFEAVLLYGRALTTPAGWSTIYWENSVVNKLTCLLDNGIVSAITCPNQTAFALVAIAVNGRQVGLKSEAYIALTNHLLHLHLKDQVALEEPALLALLRAATYWPCFYETDESISEHIRLMMTLVQLLPALGFSGESQMHGLVGAALTVFARLHQNYDSWPLLHNSDEREQRYQALTVARHYECFPPAVTTQTASLVIFGLLELLKNHTDNLGSEDLKTLFEALRCYGPRPASTINVFGLPQQVFGSDYRYMVETAIYVLTADNEGAYVWGEDARAVCIAAFNRSFAQESSQAVDVCSLALKNLRFARSGLLKQSGCALLFSVGIHGNLFSDRLKYHNMVSCYLDLLESEDQRIVPYVMAGLFEIIDRTINQSSLPLVDKTDFLQPLLSYEPFLGTTRRAEGSCSLTIDSIQITCAGAWISRLEDMMTTFPEHIWTSAVLYRLETWISFGPQGKNHPLYERYRSLYTQLQKFQDQGQPDWS